MLFPEDYEDETPNRPSIVRAVVLWLLLLLTMIACVLALPLHAEVMSFSDPLGNSVQLFDEPCATAPPWLGFRKAAMLYDGQQYEACWRIFGASVLVIDSTGDATPIPMDVFRKADGA